MTGVVACSYLPRPVFQILPFPRSFIAFSNNWRTQTFQLPSGFRVPRPLKIHAGSSWDIVEN